MQDGGGGSAPAVPRLISSEFFVPHFLTIHVQAENTNVAEIGVYALAIGRRRLGGIGILDMARALGYAFMNHRLPKSLAVIQVDGVDGPTMLVGRGLQLFAAEVQAFL